MSDDEQAFHAAIAANPGDDMPVLQYADWLRDRGFDAQADLLRDWQATTFQPDVKTTAYHGIATTTFVKIPAERVRYAALVRVLDLVFTSPRLRPIALPREVP